MYKKNAFKKILATISGIVTAICVLLSVGIIFSSDSLMVVRIILVILDLWIIYSFIRNSTNMTVIIELLTEMKEMDDEWTGIKNSIYDPLTDEDENEITNIDELFGIMSKIDEEREERRMDYNYYNYYKLEDLKKTYGL